MAKNYKTIYNSGNISIALEQRFYIKEESVHGTFAAPGNSDFVFCRQGGGIKHTQALEPSQHRTGRDNVSPPIKKKKVADWTLPVYVNIDTAVSAGATEVDDGIQVLWKSVLGQETISSGVIYDPGADPSVTFTMLECGDHWAKQMVSSFVESAEISLPGDGEAMVTFNGSGKEAIMVGIGKSTTTNAGGNTVTLATATDAYRFPVGSYVMIIKTDGTSRSTDTPVGSPRKVTAANTISGVITVDGAALTSDSDGASLTPVFLAYYEPPTPAAINNPITGLVGSITIDIASSADCVRSATLTLTNNHEKVDYCFGSDSLHAPGFVAGGKLQAELSLEINLDAPLLEFYNKLRAFSTAVVTMNLGDTASRYFKVYLPKVQFSIPEVSVPESGSIPVTFDGLAYATSLTARDEVQVSYL